MGTFMQIRPIPCCTIDVLGVSVTINHLVVRCMEHAPIGSDGATELSFVGADVAPSDAVAAEYRLQLRAVCIVSAVLHRIYFTHAPTRRRDASPPTVHATAHHRS